MDQKTTIWRSYLCNVNSKLASIFVDLAFQKTAPLANKTWLLWVWVKFQTPRSDGLSDSIETPTLYKIEDVLIEHMKQHCEAILSGRITTDGRREFYFYGNSSDKFESTIGAVRNLFSNYEFTFGSHFEPSWNQYFNVLYPHPDALQIIMNSDLLDVLKKQGDIHSIAREITHLIYFPTKKQRKTFRKSLSKQTYQVVSEQEVDLKDGPDPQRKFAITIANKQTLDPNVINHTVLEILRLAQSFDGDYDGWETPVITQ